MQEKITLTNSQPIGMSMYIKCLILFISLNLNIYSFTFFLQDVDKVQP